MGKQQFVPMKEGLQRVKEGNKEARAAEKRDQYLQLAFWFCCGVALMGFVLFVLLPHLPRLHH